MHLTTEGFEELDALWEQAPAIVQEELLAATWQGELLLEREIKDLTPVGVGGAAGLRGSIGARDPEIDGPLVTGRVGTAALHAVPVELGTKPHFPPLAPLEDWVRARLDIRGEDEVKGVALAIARKIRARGTLAVGMFHRAFTGHEHQVRGFYEAAHHRIVARLAGAS